MSKKSVSDILKPYVIFPNDQSPYISSRFEVRNHPVILRAFGIDCDTVGHIEMGYNDGCGGWFWGPYIPDCDQLAILGCANAIAIGMPGWYRIVFRDRITGLPSTGLDDLVITVTETDMPASMLAQFTGGSASMACGSQVTIREEDGCFYISVDNQAYVICPGSTVTCDPNGLGLVINGVLCPFPEIPVISAEVNDNCLTIVIDGEPFTICDTNSITIIDALGDGQYRATNPDGSIVTWNGENSVTIIDEFDEGMFRATNPDGSTVDWNGNDSVTVVSDLGDGQYQAENPDGSLVTWNGENSVTIADMDSNEGTVTITNPDGSQITFPYGQDVEPTVQTQVRNTGAGQMGQRTYIADHFGTFPNMTWRETWMERQGDIVTIHSWNPASNDWDEVAIESPEDLVILNNPVIYLRPGGSANPPINSQADLTEANAFNSMAAIRSFMNRTYVFGSVTIDGRGQMFGGNIGPAQFKNAQQIIVRGDPANAAAFSFENAGSGGAAFSCTGGNVTLQDMTFRVRDEATVPGRFGMVGNTSGGVVTLQGTIRFAGYYDTTRAQSAPAYLATAAGTSRTRIESGTQIITNFDPGTSFNGMFTAFEGGTLDIGNNLVITHNVSFEVTNIIYIQAASYWLAHMGNGAPPVVTGQDVVTSGPSVLCSNLSSTVASNWGVNMAGFFEWDWGQDSGVGQLAPLGVYGGNAGPWP